MVEVAQRSSYGLLIGGEWIRTERTSPVRDKFTGQVVGRVSQAERAHVDAAIGAAAAAMARYLLPPPERYRILAETASAVHAGRDDLARIMIAETGFTWRDVRNEIGRAVQTLQASAEEAKRIGGEVIPIQSAGGFENAFAFAFRVPVGPVAAITPFNSPLNTVCHKVAPALAAGNSVILKPATPTPLTALRLAEMLIDTGLPAGYLSVLTGAGAEIGRALAEDPRIRFCTFTGSTAVGRDIQARIGLRRSCMELGNISGTIVCEDADLDRAVPLIVSGAFRKAGQVCTSVQRIYAQRSIFSSFIEALGRAAAQLKVGNPWDADTDVGPMIDESKAAQAEAWIQDAVRRGARVLTGARREGPVLYPTVLVDVPADSPVVCEEAFAPVVSVTPYEEFEEALALVNATPYGLQAGVFTRDLRRAFEAARRLDVGGVIINGSSSTRADIMPYGGTKQSGFGREGPKYAVDEMTELRTVVVQG